MLKDPTGLSDRELGTIRNLYDAEIRYTDEQVGRLLSTVTDRVDDLTTVITADHGEEFLEHGDIGHVNTFYDEVVHVPLIVNDGQSTGDHNELVGLLDVAPTIATQAGMSARALPDNFYGSPLTPLLSGSSDEWIRDSIFGGWADINTGERRLAYRSDRWKYITDERDGTQEPYDLRRDPGETENLAGTDPEEVIAEFRDRIAEYEAQIERTQTDLDRRETDSEVRERLRNLGYQE